MDDDDRIPLTINIPSIIKNFLLGLLSWYTVIVIIEDFSYITDYISNSSTPLNTSAI